MKGEEYTFGVYFNYILHETYIKPMYQDKRIPNWGFHKWRDGSIILTTLLVAIAIVFLVVWTNLATFISLCLIAIIWLLVLFFFRDPDRVVVNRPGLVIGPGDGRVVEIVSVKENHYLNEETTRISIFLSIFDNHVQRFPLGGGVSHIDYQPGKFLQAYRPEASQVNEFIAMVIDTAYGKILVKQIAGILARRCINYAQAGDQINTGQRFGLIKFGSRVDLFLPLEAQVLVKEGDKIYGGLTPVAQFPSGRSDHAE
jgi:phosphatidylserine decarboxylase